MLTRRNPLLALLFGSAMMAASAAATANPPQPGEHPAPAGCGDPAPAAGVHHVDLRPEHGAHPPGPDGAGGFFEPPLPPYLHGIALSDEQQDRIFAIFHELSPKLREQSRAARKAHEALHELALKDAFDEAKAQSLADSGAKADEAITLLRLHADRDVLAVLTPEQRKLAQSEHPGLDCGPDGAHNRRPPAF